MKFINAVINETQLLWLLASRLSTCQGRRIARCRPIFKNIVSSTAAAINVSSGFRLLIKNCRGSRYGHEWLYFRSINKGHDALCCPSPRITCTRPMTRGHVLPCYVKRDKAFLEEPGHGMGRVMNPVARGLNKKLSTYQLTTAQASTEIQIVEDLTWIYIYKIWNETKNLDGSDEYLYMYFAKSSNYYD